jgi:hypothetical protein
MLFGRFSQKSDERSRNNIFGAERKGAEKRSFHEISGKSNNVQRLLKTCS